MWRFSYSVSTYVCNLSEVMITKVVRRWFLLPESRNSNRGLPLRTLPASIKLIVLVGTRGREMFGKHVSTWVGILGNRSRGGSQTDSHLRIPRTDHLWRSGCLLLGCDTLQAYEEQVQMRVQKSWIAPHERHDNSVVLLSICNIGMENQEFLGSCAAYLDE
jgi:hypothetical protein